MHSHSCASHNFSPVNLHSHFDGCGTEFGVTHALSCIIGNLVIVHHNKIRDEIIYLYGRAFTSASIRVKPLIHQGRTISELKIRQGSDKHKDTRGDVIFRGLCDPQVDAIIDVNICDADTDMYKYEPITSLLARWENIKKDNHSKHCHNQRKYFSLFVLSVDRMLERESLVMISQFSRFMSEKIKKPFCNYGGG